MKLFNTLGTAFAMGALLVVLSACAQKEGPVEEAGRKVDEAAQQAGEKIEEAGEEIQDAAEGNAD